MILKATLYFRIESTGDEKDLSQFKELLQQKVEKAVRDYGTIKLAGGAFSGKVTASPVTQTEAMKALKK